MVVAIKIKITDFILPIKTLAPDKALLAQYFNLKKYGITLSCFDAASATTLISRLPFLKSTAHNRRASKMLFVIFNCYLSVTTRDGKKHFACSP